MRKMPDWIIGVLIIACIMLAGFGLAKALDYADLKGGSAFAAVFLVLIGVVSWFVYMDQTDGFKVNKMKNDMKVDDIRNSQRILEASKREIKNV